MGSWYLSLCVWLISLSICPQGSFMSEHMIESYRGRSDAVNSALKRTDHGSLLCETCGEAVPTLPWQVCGALPPCALRFLERQPRPELCRASFTGAVLLALQCVSHPSQVVGRALVALTSLVGGQLWAHQSPGQGTPSRGVTSGSVLTGEAVGLV